MNQRDKMIYLLGQLQALAYPLPAPHSELSGYYDLIESIIQQYESVVKNIYPDFQMG